MDYMTIHTEAETKFKALPLEELKKTFDEIREAEFNFKPELTESHIFYAKNLFQKFFGCLEITINDAIEVSMIWNALNSKKFKKGEKDPLLLENYVLLYRIVSAFKPNSLDATLFIAQYLEKFKNINLELYQMNVELRVLGEMITREENLLAQNAEPEVTGEIVSVNESGAEIAKEAVESEVTVKKTRTKKAKVSEA